MSNPVPSRTLFVNLPVREVKKALASGCSPDVDPEDDHGFMYSWSFDDLDGHGWGVLGMDPAAAT